MTDQSWIKLYRKITEWEWYSHPPTRDLFIHLLLTVNHKPSKYRGYDIPSGAAIYGRKEIAVLLGFSEQNIRTALVNLKSTNEITIKTTNKFSIIQIVRWEEYQSSTSNLTNNQPTTNQQLTTDKEYKNIINKKDNTYVLSKKNKKLEKPDDVSESVWEDFIVHRKSKKAPVTETVLKSIRSESEKIGWTIEKAMAEMCARGWQGFKAQWIINEQKGNKNVQSSSRNLTKSERADIALGITRQESRGFMDGPVEVSSSPIVRYIPDLR